MKNKRMKRRKRFNFNYEVKKTKHYENDTCFVFPYVAIGKSRVCEGDYYLHIGWCWSVITFVFKRKRGN